jgi:hypothetical protein
LLPGLKIYLVGIFCLIYQTEFWCFAFLHDLAEVDALNLAPNVLSLLLIFQRIATSESVSEDVRSVTAAARSPLWSRLTGKIGAELIRAIGSQECTDLVEVQIEPYQELLHLLTDVPLACPAHGSTLSTGFARQAPK